MSKYLIEFKNFNACATIEYDAEKLVKLTLDYGTFDEKQIRFFFGEIPYHEQKLTAWRKLKNILINEIPEDSSFEAFWKTYDYKFGNKPRSIRIWKSLDETSRIKAIKHVKTYDNWLIKSIGINKKLPETYLNQAPWDN